MEDQLPRGFVEYVERLADWLRGSGMPAMPARVMAYLLAHPADRHTAADLADGLSISPAAVSNAVNYLRTINVVARERVTGSNRNRYRLADDDLWYHMYRAQESRLRDLRSLAAEGADLVGQATPGGQRLRRTAAFFDFLSTEYLGIMDRWRRENPPTGSAR